MQQATSTCRIMDEHDHEHIPQQSLSIDEIAYCSGTTRTFVVELLEEELIEPCQYAPEPRFVASQYREVRRLMRLHRDLGIRVESLGLVVQLLDHIEALERRLGER